MTQHTEYVAKLEYDLRQAKTALGMATRDVARYRKAYNEMVIIALVLALLCAVLLTVR